MAEDTGDLTAEQAEETIADERPDWLPENFATPQDLVTSYKEAQRRVTELGTTSARDREQIEQYEEMLTARAEPQQTGQFDPHSHPLIAGAQQAMDNGDVVGMFAAFQALQQQAAPAPAAEEARLDPFLVNQVHDSIATRYSADEGMREKALEIMQSEPLVAGALSRLSEDPRAQVGDLVPIVDAAYRLASQGALQAQQQSLAQQQAEQERSRQRKIEQEGLTGGGPTRAPNADEMATAWERIKNVDPGTMPRVNPN